MADVIPGFSAHTANLPAGDIAYSIAGSGPPLLLLHGFPQTRAMWAGIAPALAQTHTVVAADLRGYGGSFAPQATEDMGFRPRAADQVALMASLGFDQFRLIGHDRGARIGHRLTLDHPDAVLSLALLDIVPTYLLLSDLKKEVARAYYHWFFLAQPSPFPESMIGADPDAYFESCLTGLGAGSLDDFDAGCLASYRAAWRQPARVKAMCDDYRAAIDVDFSLDAADQGRQVTCPTLILYGGDGIMGKLYDVGATWEDRLTNMTAAAIPGGHFFPDTHPDETTKVLQGFLASLQ